MPLDEFTSICKVSSLFHFDLFWPKTRFWIFREFHSLESLFFFKGGWGEVGGGITSITTSGMGSS